MQNNRKPRVGLLALTLELYEELCPTLREERERWLVDRVMPALAPLADVQFDRAVFRREDIDAVVAGYEAAGVDGLVVVCLTYSPSQLSLPALGRTNLPILIWNTQELFSVGGDFDVAAMVANHGVHGTQDLANVLVRAGVPFEYVTSHLDDPAGLDALADWLAAASAVARLRRARLGLMGYPFPGMGDFALDTTHLAATIGCQWRAAVDRSLHPRRRGRPRGRRPDARRRVPPAVRRGRRCDRSGPGDYRPGGTVAAPPGRRASLGRDELPVHGDRRGRTDRDRPVRGRQPPDGRGRGVRRRGRSGGSGRHVAPGATASAGHVQRNVHDRLRGQQPADEPHGRGERGDGPSGSQESPWSPGRNRSPGREAGSWPWSRAWSPGRRRCSP